MIADCRIRPELPADSRAVHAVVAAAFDREDEARLVDELRSGGYVRVSLVAEWGGQIVGHILLSDLPIVGRGQSWSALALAPLAVTPELQNQGIGTRLVQAAHEAARVTGHRIVVVLGHPSYYPRFGFRAELAIPLEAPFQGESFMAMELVPGALRGVAGRVVYAPPFGLA